jgi:hypothetical protein
MTKISRDDLLGHLQKARIIQTEQPTTAAFGSGIPGSDVPGATPIKSVMLNPLSRLQGFKGKTIIQPRKIVDYRLLRRISEEAWLVNTLIIHLQNQVRPFLKPSTDQNVRGFQIRLKDKDHAPSETTKEYMKELTNFFIKTGFGYDPERRDDIVHFGMKAVRDHLTIDQIATELQQTMAGKVWAYWATDSATIVRVTEEGYAGNDMVRFLQEVDSVPTAYYTDNDLIFDYGNPRSDIEYSGYGYSRVESAIRLIMAQINAFAYQSGALTEDSLPRGAILLNGDASMEDVELLQDYIIDIMSGGPMSKWKIPIIPGGTSADGRGNALSFVNFRNTSREMEFVEWTEMLWSAVCALFGTDMEELGLKSAKSSPVIGGNIAPRLEESKSRGLSTVLSFLEGHFQKILDKIDDRFDFEFIGYEKDDPKAKGDLEEQQLRTYMTIDEIRQAKDLKPFNKPWSKMPLNSMAVQLEQASQMGGGMGGMPGQDQGDQGPGGHEDYRNLMMGDDGQGDGNDDEQTGDQGNEPDQGQDQEQGGGRTEKSIRDDVIEIIV